MKLFKIGLLVITCLAFSNICYGQKKSTYLEDEAQVVIKNNKKCTSTCGCKVPIRVAGFVTNPPFGWVTQSYTKDGRMFYITNGYGVDSFIKMAKNLGYKTRNVGFNSYQKALQALRHGQVDVIAGVYYTKSNLGVGTSLLSPSFIENPIITIFVKGKEKNIKKFSDLKGLKGVVRQEEVIYPLIYRQLLPGTDLKQVAGAKKAFKMLMDGEVDYMLTSLYSAEAEVRRFKLVDQIYFPNIALEKPQLFFAFSSVSSCLGLKKRFSNELKRLKKDKETYQKEFINYIDEWGQMFKDDAGLIEVSPIDNETNVEAIDNPVVEDKSVAPLENMDKKEVYQPE